MFCVLIAVKLASGELGVLDQKSSTSKPGEPLALHRGKR